MEYWLITTGEKSQPGIDGGMSKGEPNLTGGELTLDVTSVDDAARSVAEAGGSLTREKSTIPGVGWMALVGDTEGNVFGLMQEDTSAR